MPKESVEEPPKIDPPPEDHTSRAKRVAGECVAYAASQGVQGVVVMVAVGDAWWATPFGESGVVVRGLLEIGADSVRRGLTK